MSITVKQVTKRFGDFVALDNLNLEVPSGSLLALLGPSGSGKTTLLRIIAGLEVPDAGAVHYEDEDVTATRVRDRNVGFVFQHYALFRHMNVFENIAFGMRVRHRPRAEVKAHVTEYEKNCGRWKHDPDGTPHYPTFERGLDPEEAAARIARVGGPPTRAPQAR